VRYQANPRFLGDDIRLRFGGSEDAALVYDSANDELTLQTADASGDLVDRLAIQAGTDAPSAVFNEGGADADFRIEGDTDPDLFFLDAGNDRVGIGDSTPSYKLDVAGDIRSTGKVYLANGTGAAPSLAFYNDVDTGLFWVGSDSLGIALTGAECARIIRPTAGHAVLYLGDVNNSQMTDGSGITINQGTADASILAFKSSDVSHGLTAYMETDTYGDIRKFEAASGGLRINGFKDADGGAGGALFLGGLLGEDADTSKSDSGVGIIRLSAWVKNDTVPTFVNANGNIVSIEDANATTVWIVDAEGDTWQPGGVTIGGDLDHNGSNVGFYNTPPAAKQTVTG